MTDETVPVTPEVAEQVLDRLRDAAPAGWRLMPIGGTEMATVAGTEETTKDVDVVVVTLHDGTAEIPPYDDLADFARELSNAPDAVETRRDHTSVKFRLSTDAGPVTVEFVRGRTSGTGGYFVSRSVLEKAATLATDSDGTLVLPAEALAFLKAWAAHDKQKLVDADKDARGYHADRRDAFLEDVQRLREAIQDADEEPDAEVIEALFSATGGEREEAVRRILADRNWPA